MERGDLDEHSLVTPLTILDVNKLAKLAIHQNKRGDAPTGTYLKSRSQVKTSNSKAYYVCHVVRLLWALPKKCRKRKKNYKGWSSDSLVIESCVSWLCR